MFDSNTFAFTHKYVPSKCVHCAADPEIYIYTVRVCGAYCACNDHHPSCPTHTHTPKNKQANIMYTEIFDTHLMTVFFVIFKL